MLVKYFKKLDGIANVISKHLFLNIKNDTDNSNTEKKKYTQAIWYQKFRYSV